MSSSNTTIAWSSDDYVVLLRRQWLSILLCLLIGAAAAVAYVQFAPREYRTQTSVLVTSITTGASGAANGASDINLDTEAQLLTSTATVSAAAERLDVPAGQARELASRVSVSVPPNTDILDIAFTGTTPEAAQRGSTAFAEAYLDLRQQTAEQALQAEEDALEARIDAVNDQLESVLAAASQLPSGSPARNRANDQAAVLNNQLATLGSQQNQLRAGIVSPGRIVTEAPLPTSPSSPNTLVSLATGIVLGLLLGFGIAALRHRADDAIRTSEDLHRRTGVPVTADLSTRLRSGEVAILPPLSADGRGYARLRNLVTTSLKESNRRVVLVAGVRRGGGPVAANLAASLARAGEDVVLVCADVFGDTAAALFPDDAQVGLAEVLAGERPIDSVVRRLDGVPSLRVLGPGRDPDRADALLQTRSPRKLIDRLLESASYVVIEAPPTTDSPDAQTLADVAELAVLVVEVGSTTGREVLDACAQLESMGTAVLGAVIARYGRGSDSAEFGVGSADRAGDDTARDIPRGGPRSSAEGDGAPIPAATAGSSGMVPPGPRDHAPR